MAEKQLRLTACRVAITIPAMLRRAFLFFWAVWVVTTADWGFIYTPSRSSSTDAGKSALRPMGTAALAWSLFVVGLRQWSRECQWLYHFIYTTNTDLSYRSIYFSIHHAQIQSSLLCILYNSMCLLHFVRPSCTFLLLLCSYRLYNSGFSISGSCKAALCFSAICWAVCCGTPYCCVACTGAVSAMP